MAMPGECLSVVSTTCDNCGAEMDLGVYSSAAGYYLGFWCPTCGPYSRETGYMTKGRAKAMLRGDIRLSWRLSPEEEAE